MTTARRDIVYADRDGVYHCMSRCVRRAFLCGEDSYTGKNYDHRREWVDTRLKFLSTVFMVECLAYAVMSNHFHALYLTRFEALSALSAEEVAERWLRLYPKRSRRTDSYGQPVEVAPEHIRELAGDHKRIEVLRERLGSISWFMKSISEDIALRANTEDECTGRFWEGRFKCSRLDTEAAVLTCSIYVDLNPIRAELAKTPEESIFTSAFERIAALKARDALEKHKQSGGELSAEDVAELERKAAQDSWLGSIGTATSVLSISLGDYLQLLDWTGREMQKDKRGCIPQHLDPIFTRLGINGEHWIDGARDFGKCFRRHAGDSETMAEAARRIGQAWFHGIGYARLLFDSPVRS